MATKGRSLVKACTWRFLATLTTSILVLVFTGELILAFSVGVFEVVLKLLIYYAHERIWDGIKWGKKN